jgi:hypothetical protein
MTSTNGTVVLPRQARDPVLAWSCRAAIVLVVAGVFGPWRRTGTVSLDGVQGPHNGWLVIIFALLALIGVSSMSRGSWLGIVTVLGSVGVMLFAVVENLSDDNAVLGGHSTWGLWLTIAAAGVLAVGALLAAWRRLRSGRRAF